MRSDANLPAAAVAAACSAERGARISGCTVYYVNEMVGVDGGSAPQVSLLNV